MDLELIERLLEIVAQSGMAEVEVEHKDFKVVVRAHQHTVQVAAPLQAITMAPTVAGPASLSGAPAPVALHPVGVEAVEVEAPGTVVHAPIVGTLYSAPAPGADPFVKVGDRVELGSVLCIIEAMKLMNEIQSEHAGVVLQILVGDGQPVEYDQPLFVIEEA